MKNETFYILTNFLDFCFPWRTNVHEELSGKGLCQIKNFFNRMTLITDEHSPK